MRRLATQLGLAAVLVAGCGGDESGGGGTFDAAAPTGDAGGNPDAAPPEDTSVRFILMGDTGEGNEAQSAVADAIEAKCAADGCDFVVLLGDNIYDSGVSGVDDPQWQTKFEEPYADIDLPFYAALGNHDYGGDLIGVETGGLGNEWDKGPIEVLYTDVSDKWVMPATHYTFTVGNVGFIMLDTNSIMWANIEHGNQADWYPTALAEVADADWVIAAGHHPVRSNGAHGNAGNYESIEVGGVEVPNPLPILNGDNVEAFFDDVVCGTVDVYASGHDHTRQWINEPGELCGAELIVSGAGAKVKALQDRGNEVFYEDAEEEGFMYVVIDGDTFTGQFIDRNGEVDFERTFTRTP